MEAGSVVVDVAIDQGGSFATSKPTTHENPIYEVEDIVHYCVSNMPGAVPRSSSQVLSTALVPYLLRLSAPDGIADPALASGVNVRGGQVVHPALRAALPDLAH